MDRINFCLIAAGIASFVYLVEPRTVYLDGVAPGPVRYSPSKTGVDALMERSDLRRAYDPFGLPARTTVTSTVTWP